jgi:glutamine amidotransferase
MVLIVDYGMGNIGSVAKVLKKLDVPFLISKKKEDIHKAEKIILPGVGAFGDGMNNLKSLNIEKPLREKVLGKRTPFLGICLGMQLLAEQGNEFGKNKGLGWIQGEVKKLETGSLRLPHMGWNSIDIMDHFLFRNISDNDFYFVHSYHFACVDEKIISAKCDYGEKFVAALHQDNIFGTQFHPEKSQESGIQLIKNFLEYA